MNAQRPTPADGHPPGNGAPSIAALIGDAQELVRTGAAQRALAPAREALASAERGNDPAGCAAAAEALAEVHYALSAYPEALAQYFAALERWRGLHDDASQVRCLHRIASVDIYIGDYALAMGRLEEALQLLQGTSDEAAVAAVYHRLGMVYARLGDLARAREFYEAALEKRRRLDDRAAIASSLNSLGVLFLRLGQLSPGGDNLARARSLFEEAVALAEQAGDVHLKALAMGNVGSAVAELGDLQRALTLFDVQLAALRAMGSRYDEALCLTNIGEALRRLGRSGDSLAPLRTALRIGEELKSKERMMRAWHELSQCQEALGDLTSALESYKHYHRLDRALHSEEAENKARNLVVQFAVKKVRDEADGYRAERDELAAANVLLTAEAKEDALTGLPNRRYLDASLERVFIQAVAENRALCFAVADVDHFKSINDRHSHAIGDEVLRTVGRILRSACRPSDLAGRYGGEEFVLVLLDMPSELAFGVCERLRAAVASHAWDALRPGLTVTISIGIADRASYASSSDMLAAADARLYEAKRAGRNCVR
ncbi:MAG TPA: diguanylate cyclase [Casimicrobiaceae bacterium]|nr:diguanylate cyclase [Casimicrobiaceae bacterium]